MDSDARANIALMVAAGSALISLTGLFWQVALYRLSGARVAVRLLPAIITEAGHLVRGPAKGWKSTPPSINIVGGRVCPHFS